MKVFVKMQVSVKDDTLLEAGLCATDIINNIILYIIL